MWTETPNFCQEVSTKKFFKRLCSDANALRLLRWWPGDLVDKIDQLKGLRCIFQHSISWSKSEFKSLRPDRLDTQSTLYEMLAPLFVNGERTNEFLTHLLTLCSFPTRLLCVDTEDLVEDMLQKYIAEEEELKELSKHPSTRELELLEKMRHVVYRWFRNYEPKLYKPEHTNGATARVRRGDGAYAKYRDFEFTREAYELQSIMGWNPIMVFEDVSSSNHGFDPVKLDPKDDFSLRFPNLFKAIDLPSGALDPCFWDTVPKAVDKRRGISYEVTWRSFNQKLVGDSIKHYMATVADMYCDLFDQGDNQHLAWLGSLTGEYSSLDLTSASDRVRWWHIQYIFQDLPLLLDMFDMCRAPIVDFSRVNKQLPRMQLEKHAPMGSATCFPAMCPMFCALIKVVLEEQGIRDRYGVYGDDIMVPTRAYQAVIDGLEALGMIVNRDKSFTKPYLYRESCGIEAYQGMNVTPLYISRNFDIRFQYKKGKFIPTVEHYEGLTALCNRLGQWGYRLTRKVLLSAMLEVYPLTPFSHNMENGIYTLAAETNAHLRWSMRPCARYDSESARIPMVKTYCVVTQTSRTPEEFRYGLKLEQMSFRNRDTVPDPSDLGSATGGKVYTRLKIAWIPASRYE